MDPRMQAFIQQEQEKAKLQNVIHEINEKCWDVSYFRRPKCSAMLYFCYFRLVLMGNQATKLMAEQKTVLITAWTDSLTQTFSLYR